MIKKIALGLGLTLAVLVVLGYSFQEQIMFALIKSQIGPDHAFDASLTPTAPDYADDKNWAALPGIEDPSDSVPEGVTDTNKRYDIPVFFVHPTSYINSANWNQPLEDHDANWIVDERVLRHQASVFSGCCDIYAPRYRQATFYSFLDEEGNGEKALEVAYADVVAAFDEFIARIDGAPFILAGHSQGTRHSAQLLRERISGTDLQQRLVAAYLIGFAVTAEQIGDVPVCEYADEPGCVIAWNVVLADGAGLNPDVGKLICTNPHTWLRDGGYAEHILNDGAIGYPSYMVADDTEDYTRMVVEQEVADAECVDGNLVIRDLRSESFPSVMPGGSLHVYDYSLYYMNLRNNVVERIHAFKKERI